MKINILILILSLVLIGGIALAQEETTPTPAEAEATSETSDETEEVALDEEVNAEDLEVGEPNLLPDNPFYFLKEWGRGIQSLFTFDPVKKAELKEKFANEKLLEVKKMVEQNKTRKQIENAVRLYENEIGEVERVAQTIRERAEENEEVGKFLDKFIQHQALHQRVLQKLEEQVPAEVYEKIEQTREMHIEKFGEVMTKLETEKEQLQERLEKNLQEVKGSEFKEFKNLEVLKGLEEKVPEEAKEAIQNAQEKSLLRLKETLEKLPVQTQERFKAYTEEISGEKEKHLEIIEKLKEELREAPAIQQNLLEAGDKILERIRVQKQEQEQELEQKQEQAKEGACIEVWEPVCGADGKTYSNRCFAELAGVEISHEGECQKEEVEKPASGFLGEKILEPLKKIIPFYSSGKFETKLETPAQETQEGETEAGNIPSQIQIEMMAPEEEPAPGFQSEEAQK